jgi:NADH:ubiquinone oxidoreductase subunit 3 (subunit A)
VKRVAGNDNTSLLTFVILLEYVSYYFVLSYIIFDAETVLWLPNTVTKSVVIQWALTPVLIILTCLIFHCSSVLLFLPTVMRCS